MCFAPATTAHALRPFTHICANVRRIELCLFSAETRVWLRMLKESVVTLEDLVPSEKEREMAEFDAWLTFAVEDVINRIELEEP